MLGVLALLPGLGLLAGGTAIAIAQAAADDGYFTVAPDRVESDGVAVITDDEWLDAHDGGPWVLDFLDLDVRLRADGTGPSDYVFVGITRTADVERYLAGAPFSIVDEIDGRDVRYRQDPGDDIRIGAPIELDIWMTSASGTGQQEITWEARGGRWSVVVMNSDGSPAIDADVEISARSDAVTPIAVTPIAVALIVLGGITVLTGVGLIVLGVRGRRHPVARVRAPVAARISIADLRRSSPGCRDQDTADRRSAQRDQPANGATTLTPIGRRAAS